MPHTLSFFFFFFFFLVFLLFLGPLPRHMEVPRLGVESELQPPAYTRATATRDPSRVCNLHHSSRQRRILNPLTRPGTQPATSWFLVGFINHCATKGTPALNFFCLEVTHIPSRDTTAAKASHVATELWEMLILPHAWRRTCKTG